MVHGLRGSEEAAALLTKGFNVCHDQRKLEGKVVLFVEGRMVVLLVVISSSLLAVMLGLYAMTRT